MEFQFRRGRPWRGLLRFPPLGKTLEGPPLSERQSPPSLPRRDLPRPAPACKTMAQEKCSAGRAPAGDLPFLGEGNRKIAAGRQEKRFARQRNRSAAVGFRLLTSRANARLSAVHQSSGVFLSGRARPQMSNMPPAPKEFPRRTVPESRPPAPPKFSPPTREIPRRGPPGGDFAIQYAKNGGLAPGKVSPGGPRGTGLSLRGGSLQGLSHRQTDTPAVGGNNHEEGEEDKEEEHRAAAAGKHHPAEFHILVAKGCKHGGLQRQH